MIREPPTIQFVQQKSSINVTVQRTLQYSTPYLLTLWPTWGSGRTLDTTQAEYEQRNSVMDGSTMNFASWRDQAVLQLMLISGTQDWSRSLIFTMITLIFCCSMLPYVTIHIRDDMSEYHFDCLTMVSKIPQPFCWLNVFMVRDFW
jgi:hypothetical protein